MELLEKWILLVVDSNSTITVWNNIYEVIYLLIQNTERFKLYLPSRSE